MAARPQPIDGQQILLDIIVAEQTHQMYVVPNPDQMPETASVNLIEHYIRLQNVVTHLAKFNQLRHFVGAKDPSERTYGQQRAPFVRASATENMQSSLDAAKTEFALATGQHVLVHAGESDRSAKRLTESLFSDFLKQYFGHDKHHEAQAFRARMAATVKILQADKPAVHISPAEKAVNPGDDDTAEKLRTLSSDPRAEFLPATSWEKTLALNYLRYLGDDKSPKATADWLMSVFVGGQNHRTAGVNDGKRALESIIYELSDFAQNAFNSRHALQKLYEELRSCQNPGTTLQEAAGTSPPGLEYLLRYIDIRAIRDDGVDARTRKGGPLTNHEIRISDGEGRRKFLSDQYTQNDSSMRKRVAAFSAITAVESVKDSIIEAINNETRRLLFFTSRLHDVHALPNKTAFKHVKEVAQAEIDHILEPA